MVLLRDFIHKMVYILFALYFFAFAIEAMEKENIGENDTREALKVDHCDDPLANMDRTHLEMSIPKAADETLIKSNLQINTPLNIQQSISHTNDEERRHVFTTNEEMKESRQKIVGLYKLNKYENVIEEFCSMPSIEILEVDQACFEDYKFNLYYSAVVAYRQKGNANKVGAQGFYYKSLKEAQYYLSNYAKCSSDKNPSNLEIEKRAYRALVLQEAGLSSSKIAIPLIDMTAQVQNSDILKLLNYSVCATEESLKYISLLPPEYISESLVFEIQNNLFGHYINLAPFSEKSIEKEFISRAREIYKKVKNNPRFNETYKQQMALLLEVAEDSQQSDSKVKRPKGSNRVEKLRISNQLNRTRNLSENMSAIQKQIGNQSQMPFKTQILDKHLRLSPLVMNSKVRNTPEPDFLNLLTEIEEQIREHLIVSIQPNNMSDIYEMYATIRGEESLRKDLKDYIIPAFILLDDIDGALERANMLRHLELKMYKNVPWNTRCLCAAIKNMKGDHQEWIEIEREFSLSQEKKNETKETEKQKKEEQLVNIIKEDQKKKLSSQRTSGAKKEGIISQTHVKFEKEAKSEFSIDQEDSYGHLSPTVSRKEEIEGKRKRHEEAEKKRESQKNQSISVIIEDKKTLEVVSMISQPEIQDIPFAIKDLYSLPAIAKKVDEEIENNTWVFTRQNLMNYFEALECTATNGAKHKKVSLPEALIVSHNGITLTIINELGGALTLPRWDGPGGNGQVPIYLRKQILEARKKLWLLAVKGKQTIEKQTS